MRHLLSKVSVKLVIMATGATCIIYIIRQRHQEVLSRYPLMRGNTNESLRLLMVLYVRPVAGDVTTL